MSNWNAMTILILTDKEEAQNQIDRHLTGAGYTTIKGKVGSPPTITSSPDKPVKVAVVEITNLFSDGSSPIHVLKVEYPLISVIALIEPGAIQIAVQAMREGASAVLTKPLDSNALLKSLEESFVLYDTNLRNQTIMQEALLLLQTPNRSFAFPIQHHPAETAIQYVADAASADVLQSGELIFDLAQSQAFRGQTSLNLTQTEFDLLIYLARANHQVITIEELYYHLHGFYLDKASARTSLTAHLSNARQKLKQVGCENNLINVRGRGYRWNPEGRALNNHEIKLDLLLEQLPIMLWTTDSNLRLTSMVGAHLANLPMKTEDMIGLTPQEVFFQEADYLPTLKAQQQALKGQKATCEQPAGDQIFQVFVEPLLSEQDQIVGCLGFALNITQRKRLEEAYHLLVNNSIQGMTIFQKNRTVFANAAMAQITGYSVEELTAMDDPASILVHAEDRPIVAENIRKRLAGEDAPQTYEHRIITKDGTIRWIELFATLTYLNNEPAIQTAVLDRTGEKLAHFARRQAEEFCRFLVSNLPDMAVLLFDHDLRYIIAEGPALAEAGYAPGTVEGHTIWEVLPLERAEALIPYYRAALAGQTTRFEWQAEDRVYEIRTLPIRNDLDEIIAGMFLIRIVT